MTSRALASAATWAGWLWRNARYAVARPLLVGGYAVAVSGGFQAVALALVTRLGEHLAMRVAPLLRRCRLLSRELAERQ